MRDGSNRRHVTMRDPSEVPLREMDRSGRVRMLRQSRSSIL